MACLRRSTKKGDALLGKSPPDRTCVSGTGICTLGASVGSYAEHRTMRWPSLLPGASWDPAMHTDLKTKASYKVNKALKGTEIFEHDLGCSRRQVGPPQSSLQARHLRLAAGGTLPGVLRPAAEDHAGR